MSSPTSWRRWLPAGAEEGIVIRDATDADVPAIVEILNIEIAESAYIYAEVPVTVEERRAWGRPGRRAGRPAKE